MNIFQTCAEDVNDCLQHCFVKQNKSVTYKNNGLVVTSKNSSKLRQKSRKCLKNKKISLKNFKRKKVLDNQNYKEKKQNIDYLHLKKNMKKQNQEKFVSPNISKISKLYRIPQDQQCKKVKYFKHKSTTIQLRNIIRNDIDKSLSKLNATNHKELQKSLVRTRINFSYITTYNKANTPIKSEKETMAINIFQQGKQCYSKFSPSQKCLRKKYSCQQKILQSSHQMRQSMDSLKLKKVISENINFRNFDQQIENQTSNKDEYQKQHKRQQSQINLQKQNQTQKLIMHQRHQSEIINKTDSLRDIINKTDNLRDQLVDSTILNQDKIRNKQDKSQLPKIILNLIVKNNQQKQMISQNQEFNKIASLNFAMLNLTNMDFCRKTQSIHDSTQKQDDQFSQIIQQSQQQKKLLTSQNIVLKPFIFSKFKEQKRKMKSSMILQDLRKKSLMILQK